MTKKSNKQTLDEKWIEKNVVQMYEEGYRWKDTFIAAIRYGRRSATQAINQEPILVGAPYSSDFWKGVSGGKAWAIRAIKARSRK